ncbi:hypothetical protein JXA40_10240 [bacterium]|nr:hypothetical protein [candidate division CSSED10-310 bacterium]
MMRKKMMAVMAAGLIIGFAAVADARNFQGPRGEGIHHLGMYAPLIQAPWDHVEMIAGEIGLSEDQMASLSKIRRDHRHVMEPLRSQLKLQMGDLQDLMNTGGTAAQKQCLSLADSIEELRTNILKEQISISFSLDNLLTGEQKDKLNVMAADRRDDRREKMKSRRDGARHGRRGENPPWDQD